VQYSLLNCKQ